MLKTGTGLCLQLLLVLAVFCTGYAQNAPADLPRLHLDGFQYEGAFRLPATTYGDSSLNYSEGPIAYNPNRHSLYVVGHSHDQAVAEFLIPPLKSSSALSDLHMAVAPEQNFVRVLERVSGGNPQNVNRIGGMHLFSRPGGFELLVNAYEYYDAPGDNTHTTFSIRDADALSTSTIDGFFALQPRAHASGWISPVPEVWRETLGTSYISGNSSGIPIIGRTSVGPSAFGFDPYSMVDSTTTPNPIPTQTFLDFSLGNPLHSDLSNDSRTNALWTHLSRATFGFIAPNSRTYVTIGHSGGHSSGVCYKCTQTNGNLCGGYCARDHSDTYHYYWLWDVNDLLRVKNGEIAAHEVRPYEYGVLPTPFNSTEIGGGSFDPASGRLYLTAQRADREQGRYANPPVVLVYTFDPDTPQSRERAPIDFDGDKKSDFTVVRPGVFAQWYSYQSRSNQLRQAVWGLSDTDVFLDVDVNGDGWNDLNATIMRSVSPSMPWFSLLSPDYGVSLVHWGEPGDIPLSADFDADRVTDLSIYRPRDGSWWIIQSDAGFLSKQWGLAGDLPVVEDFDGDAKSDFAIWRPVSGMWAVLYSAKNYSTALGDIIWKQWGLSGDHPMPGDYDGDGRADLVVWRNLDGAWYVCPSTGEYQCAENYFRVQFGLPGDIPIKGDFDADGVLDFAVWRPSSGTWYWRRSSDGLTQQKQWGLPGDYPLGAGIKSILDWTALK